MSEIVIYNSPENLTQIEVTFDNETVWLSLNQISELFGRDKSVISRHLKKIYNESELLFEATVAKNATVQNEAGNKRIGDNALVAITIMIAESKSEEKDIMTKLVVNLINNKN